jgi:hypothetical protein
MKQPIEQAIELNVGYRAKNAGPHGRVSMESIEIAGIGEAEGKEMMSLTETQRRMRAS